MKAGQQDHFQEQEQSEDYCVSTSLYMLYIPFNQFLVLSVHISKTKSDCKENVGYRAHVKPLTY